MTPICLQKPIPVTNDPRITRLLSISRLFKTADSFYIEKRHKTKMNLNYIFVFLTIAASVTVGDPKTRTKLDLSQFIFTYGTLEKQSRSKWDQIKKFDKIRKWRFKIHLIVLKFSFRIGNIFLNREKESINIQIMLPEYVIVFDYWLKIKLGFQSNSRLTGLGFTGQTLGIWKL